MISRLHRRETFGQNQVSIAFRILIVEAVEPDVKAGLERKVRNRHEARIKQCGF